MKGSAYERDVCKMLGKWWSEGARDDVFWRTAGSGARATVRSSKGQKTSGQYGDICAIDETGKDFLKVFAVELKRGYSQENFLNMLDAPDKAKKQLWETFYDQAFSAAYDGGSRHWMLVWKRDKRRALVYISALAAKELNGSGSTLFERPHLQGELKLRNGVHFLRVFCCAFEAFLNAVTPKQIKSLLQ